MLVQHIDNQTFTESTLDIDVPIDLVNLIARAIEESDDFIASSYMAGDDKKSIVMGASTVRQAGGPSSQKWKIKISRIPESTNY